MQHSFDIAIAEKFGVNVAIFLNNIAFWVKKNEANKKHFYDGRYWTYNSSEALSALFPYWSSDQMDRLIKKCTSLNLILVDNFNETTYDRTRWYGLTDKSLKLFNMTIPRNRGMDPAESRNGSREIAEPIPDNKPDNKPNKRERAVAHTTLSTDFKPDKETKALFKETVNRCHIDPEELQDKFIDLCKTTNKVSADWNAELRNFLRREKPSSKKQFNQSQDEVRCTVPDWGPGNPGWDSYHGSSSH